VRVVLMLQIRTLEIYFENYIELQALLAEIPVIIPSTSPGMLGKHEHLFEKFLTDPPLNGFLPISYGFVSEVD
jgi:hypothetical protein